jgi:hypothetical protein
MVSIIFTGHTSEWRYSLYNEVPPPLLANPEKKKISSKSPKHVR